MDARTPRPERESPGRTKACEDRSPITTEDNEGESARTAQSSESESSRNPNRRRRKPQRDKTMRKRRHPRRRNPQQNQKKRKHRRCRGRKSGCGNGAPRPDNNLSMSPSYRNSIRPNPLVTSAEKHPASLWGHHLRGFLLGGHFPALTSPNDYLSAPPLAKRPAIRKGEQTSSPCPEKRVIL